MEQSNSLLSHRPSWRSGVVTVGVIVVDSIPTREKYISIRSFHAIESSRGAAARSVTAKSTGCGFDSHSKEMKYLLKFIFSFLHSGVEAKRGVEFCHSTRNSSRIRQHTVLCAE